MPASLGKSPTSLATISSMSPGRGTCTGEQNRLSQYSIVQLYRDGSLILPAEVGRRNLAPLYERINSAIRAEDR